MGILVKICGLNTPEAMDATLAAGADMVGLVFFPRSPRHVSLAQGQALAQQARGRADVVALTVDAEDGLIDAIVEEVRPEWLQCHGHESPERLNVLRTRFNGRLIKAVGIREAADLGRLGVHGGVDRLLLDAKPAPGASRPGGNGEPFDWRLLAGLDLGLPFMLSGGLAADNVAGAVGLVGRTRSFVGVDVSSGVESAPGVKDDGRIAAFVAAVRGAARQPAPPAGGVELAFARVCAAVADLPEVAASTSYGTPSLVVRGKFMMRMKDAETIVVRCPIEDKELLLGAAPDIYFETDHYKGWPAILLRLVNIGAEELRHRLEQAWRMQAPKRLVQAYEKDRAA